MHNILMYIIKFCKRYKRQNLKFLLDYTIEPWRRHIMNAFKCIDYGYGKYSNYLSLGIKESKQINSSPRNSAKMAQNHSGFVLFSQKI